MKKYDNYYNKYINYVKVYCKCGRSLHFLRNHSAICRYCGRKVYPSDKSEFKEKFEIVTRKIKGEMTY